MWSPNSFPRQRDISNDKTIDLPCITTNKYPISYQTLTYHISSNNAGRMPLKQTKGCTLTIQIDVSSESMVFERVCVKTFAFRVCEWERMWMSVQWV